MNNIEDKLNKFIGKYIIIKQNGFLDSEFTIEKLSFLVEYEIFNIKDEKSTNYIKINSNQIYHVKYDTNKISFLLDNDIEIILEIKR